jgi:hypothetical protein
VEHQEHGIRLVQINRFADLIKDKLAIGLTVITGQALGAAGHADGIEMGDIQTLDQLAQRHFKAIIEAPDDGSVALIAFAWRVEVKKFANGGTPLKTII